MASGRSYRPVVERRFTMEERGVSLADIQAVPRNCLILLVGTPGAGKSAFCQQMVLRGLAAERPIVFVTTEQSPSGLLAHFEEKAMGKPTPGALSFVDAFAQTVGLSTQERSDTIHANCEDLNSITMAIARLEQRIGRKDILLAFDSLTSPYLFNREEIFRFLRLCLLKFAAEGNSVVALMDEGCGKEEDVGAMMSLSTGVFKMGVDNGSRVMDIVKHPVLEPSRIELPTDRAWRARALDAAIWDPEWMKLAAESLQRGEMGQLETRMGVNLFWPNLMRCSGMLWDPRRFPLMTYEVWKAYGAMTRDMIPFFPWLARLFLQIFIPNCFSEVRDMKRLSWLLGRLCGEKGRRDGILEYVAGASQTGEHTFRVYESTECWGFQNLGTAMAAMLPATIAGGCKGFEREERDWNAIETKCIGLGDPYCEFKVVQGDIPELKGSLEKDPLVMEKINDRLMQRLMAFLLEGRPLVEGRRLGTEYLMGGNILPMAGGERYRMALRMGGAKVGKDAGERLVGAGMEDDDAVQRILALLDHCQVGRIQADETIRIWDNRESVWTELLTTKWEEPGCFFTTGFLNGFLSAVKNQRVRETKCIAMGDPYCEWEIL
jgi:predicted hydrocarbon binding protein/KaiC/GvpD/RAD55 family RecA-like ATPase